MALLTDKWKVKQGNKTLKVYKVFAVPTHAQEWRQLTHTKKVNGYNQRDTIKNIIKLKYQSEDLDLLNEKIKPNGEKLRGTLEALI